MQQTTGVLFALLTTLSWSICIFPFTIATRKLGANTLNHFRLLLAMLLLAGANLIVAPDAFLGIFSSDHFYSWTWLGLSGIVGLTLGDYFAFRMYAVLGPRKGSVLTTLSPAAALLSGLVLLGEGMNIIGIAGMLVTMAGVMGISLSRNERSSIPDHGHGSIATGIFIGVLGAICQGVGLVLSKKGMVYGTLAIPPLPATFMRITIGFISLVLFTTLRGQLTNVIRPLRNRSNKGLSSAIAGTVFGPFLGVCLSLFTVQRLNAGVAQTIFSFVPAGALLISFFFYREKITRLAVAGLLVAVIGVLLLIWRDPILAQLTG